MYRIAIIGSRDYPDPEKVDAVVEYLAELRVPNLMIVSGGARGVDSWAEAAARRLRVPTEIIKPDPALGRSRWRARNMEIVGRSDLVIAFWDGKSAGTKFGIDYARQIRRECWVL